jgi:ribosome-associated toxin RatA of RatAB toxin-antitoxin module
MKFKSQYHLRGDVEKIQSYFSDLKIYGKLHPLINSVKEIKSKDAFSSLYEVREKLYTWIPFSVKYQAAVKQQENLIGYQIKKIPFTKLNFNYEFIVIGESEFEIKFRVYMHSSLLGRKSMFKKIINAQNQLMNNVLLEAYQSEK